MSDTKKEPRRLVSLKAREISLVDDPAVPSAKFLIAKRNEQADKFNPDHDERGRFGSGSGGGSGSSPSSNPMVGRPDDSRAVRTIRGKLRENKTEQQNAKVKAKQQRQSGNTDAAEETEREIYRLDREAARLIRDLVASPKEKSMLDDSDGVEVEKEVPGMVPGDGETPPAPETPSGMDEKGAMEVLHHTCMALEALAGELPEDVSEKVMAFCKDMYPAKAETPEDEGEEDGEDYRKKPKAKPPVEEDMTEEAMKSAMDEAMKSLSEPAKAS